MDKVAQVNIGAFYRDHKEEVLDAIERVLDSGWYVLGESVATFENAFANFCQVENAVGVANGTDAIELALRGLNVGSGDLVATVSHTAVATVSAIERIGAIPVFVDIDPQRFTMCPSSLEAVLTEAESQKYGKKHVKAVVPVHIYGQCADMDSIKRIADDFAIPVVEDCAQSHGALYNGKRAGSMGRVGTFSFYPTKNLGACGDGGAVVTHSKSLADRIIRLRQYGWGKSRESEIVGVNSRLDELLAAVLSVRLKYLEAENHQRKDIAATYHQELAALPLTLPHCASECDHVYHLFVVREKRRAQFIKFMEANDVAMAIHYPLPVHKQRAYEGRSLLAPKGLPNTESVCADIVSLPIHPALSESNVLKVCETIARFYA